MSGGRKSPSGVQGKAPVGGLGDEVSQKLKQNVKLTYNLCRLYVQNLGFNEYRSRAWTVYLQTHNQQNSEDSMGVEPPYPPPLGTPVRGHTKNKATTRQPGILCGWSGRLE